MITAGKIFLFTACRKLSIYPSVSLKDTINNMVIENVPCTEKHLRVCRNALAKTYLDGHDPICISNRKTFIKLKI